MKKLLLLLAALAICIAAGLATIAVIYRYDNYKTEQRLEKDREAANSALKNAQAANLQKEEISSLRKDITAVEKECKKGASAYALLSPFTKTQVEAPDCTVVSGK